MYSSRRFEGLSETDVRDMHALIYGSVRFPFFNFPRLAGADAQTFPAVPGGVQNLNCSWVGGVLQ